MDEKKNMLMEDSNPHAYIFLSCNEKIRAIVVQPTTAETNEDRLTTKRQGRLFNKQECGTNQ